jgi:hypothetical protein
LRALDGRHPIGALDVFFARWLSPVAFSLSTLVIAARALSSGRPSGGWLHSKSSRAAPGASSIPQLSRH